MISQIKQQGFTIVELLIVIVIIGILAAISIVAYNGVTQKARDDQRVSDARNIANAAASYNAEYGTWPTARQVKGVDDVTGAAAGTKFTTVKLTGTAAERIGQASGTALTAAPAVGDKDRKYWYRLCTDGVQVHYWVEGKSSAVAESVTAGTC